MTPQKQTITPIIRPIIDFGMKSPYPTVAIETITHQIEFINVQFIPDINPKGCSNILSVYANIKTETIIDEL